MEGLTVTPDGKLLVGMMQSALVNDPTNDPIGNPYAIMGRAALEMMKLG